MLWKDSGEGGDFTPAPSGTQVGRCFQIIDLGTHYNEMFGNTRRQVYIGFELPNELHEFKDKDGNEKKAPFTVGKFYTMSLNEKANLRHDLESWRAKPFTDEELKGFNPKNIMGVPCMLSVVHKEKNGKVKANITAISKMVKGMECPEQFNDPVYFSLDDYSEDDFLTLSKGFQEMIKRSEEWQKKENKPVKPEFVDDDIPDF